VNMNKLMTLPFGLWIALPVNLAVVIAASFWVFGYIIVVLIFAGGIAEFDWYVIVFPLIWFIAGLMALILLKGLYQRKPIAYAFSSLVIPIEYIICVYIMHHRHYSYLLSVKQPEIIVFVLAAAGMSFVYCREFLTLKKLRRV
jgi:hypothetical protein